MKRDVLEMFSTFQGDGQMPGFDLRLATSFARKESLRLAASGLVSIPVCRYCVPGVSPFPSPRDLRQPAQP